MSQCIGQGHPCAIPEEPNAKADGIQWDHLDVGLAPSCAVGGQNGFARMRWALEQMVERQSVNKVLGTVVVRAELVPG
jgi:hypothetical protein